MNRRIQEAEQTGERLRCTSPAGAGRLSQIHLEPPAAQCLAAAEGWLGLGNPVEAGADIDRIQPAFRGHPDVLQVRCRVCAALDKWPEAMIICRTLTHIAPDRLFGWLNLSVALNKMDRTAEAIDALRPALTRFRNDPLPRYAMARYECRLGRLAWALAWLHDAMDLGNPFQFMSAALQDPGLEPLWKELEIPAKAPEA